MDNKKLLSVIVGLIILALGVGFWYWSQRKAEEPKGVVETAKAVSQ